MKDNDLSNRLLLAGVSLISFGLVLWWQTPTELRLHHALLLARGPLLPWIERLTALGGLAVLGPLTVLIVLALAAAGRRADALWLFITVASGRLVVEGVKDIVARPRPPLPDQLAHASSWSFPSSHSVGTMLTCISLALLGGGSPPAILAALLVAAVIGWSRLALGVHWPSDVLAGWGFGLIWAAIAWRYAGAKRSG